MTMSVVRLMLIAVLLGSCRNELTTEPSPLASQLEDPLPSDQQFVRRIAQIEFYGDPVVFDAPSEGKVGVPLEAGITTYGGGCIQNDTIYVSVSGLTAEIVPMQRVPSQPTVCTMELHISRRPVKLVFSEAGSATVRVTGRSSPSGSLIGITRRVAIGR